MSRRHAGWIAGALGLGLVVLGLGAPARLPGPVPEAANLAPWVAPPLGTDPRGRPLWVYAAQGAAVVTGPSALAGGILAGAAVGAGLVRCGARPELDGAMHGLGELLGSLPRLPMVLVAALLVPAADRDLWPLALTWAVLAAPGAMDEAATVAGRLGGARFVEALRAHGYSWSRVYLYHLVALNLRPVVVRQGMEAVGAVVFLEVAVSWLAEREGEASLAHPEAVGSWADLVAVGYPSLVVAVPTGHALALGVGLCAAVLLATRLATHAAEAR